MTVSPRPLVAASTLRSGTITTPQGIELCYDERGPEDGTPLLFIMGLSAQMVFWPAPLLDDLAARGFRVIRFDNRDVGLSTKLRGAIRHSPAAAIARATLGLKVHAPYTLHDMVEDTCALLDALEIERAHLVGVSMGGMISQLMAATRAQRVSSLTSIMSGTNSRWLPPPKPAALKTLVAPRVRIENREQYIAFGHDMMKKIGGTLDPGAALVEQMFGESWERGLYPRGIRQQFFAVLATGDLTPHVKKIRCPATIIHGAEDPLIRPAGGKASAKHIPGARLHMIPGMGHDLPESVLPQIADLIEETVGRA
ncbi:alpha/beta fold hydrolase [Alcanivorax limicola]|uniref:alpha/beta fold hydrolase n=1 Tax=Alcanivorax limicola TaxID=2874102 RepID=UPI001CC0EA9A|nr:alpha/beta hydrolase [Alcanivorax limicola]